MKILISGSTGFLGHHLVQYFLEHTDWDIVCLDRLDLSSSLHRLDDIINSEIEHRVKFIYHDLKSPIEGYIKERLGNDINYIVHTAASSHVSRSIQDPMSFFYDNVIGTGNLLMWARTLPNLYQIINFGTDEEFGPALHGENYTEWDRHAPGNPYAASKSGATQLAHAFHVTYNLPIITTHCVNIFGERQYHEKFITKVIRAALNSDPVYIHCSINSWSEVTYIGSRIWIDVKDVCSAIYTLILVGKVGKRYNITSKYELNNSEIVDKISSILYIPIEKIWVDYDVERPGYDKRYALDGRLLEELGWKPGHFDTGFSRVVKWTAQHEEWR